MIRTILFCTGTIALASTAALADPNAEADAKPQFKPEAAESSLMISPAQVSSRDDAQKLGDSEFLIADVNVDGAVDKSEFDIFVGAAPDGADAAALDKTFTAIAKSDSKITRQEMIDARTKSFDQADGNRDKRLDAAEQKKFATLVTGKPAAEPVAQ
jgi:hypothetical protein